MAERAYFAHNGIHDMSFRKERLEKIAFIISRYIEDCRQAGSSGLNGQSQTESSAKPFSIAKRALLGNIYEELSRLYGDNDERGGHYRDLALELYASIALDEDVAPYLAHKINAEFSILEMVQDESLSATPEPLNSATNNHRQQRLRDSRQCFYELLLDQGNYMLEHLQNNGSGKLTNQHMIMMSGTLTEVIVYGEIMDAITLSSSPEKLDGRIKVRRAFAREDHNETTLSGIGSARLAVPIFSFDLAIENSGEVGPLSKMNIEVKKGKRYPKGRFINKYLPITRLIGVDAPKLPVDFAVMLVDYSKAKLKSLRGEWLSAEEQALIDNISQTVKANEMIDEFA